MHGFMGSRTLLNLVDPSGLMPAEPPEPCSRATTSEQLAECKLYMLYGIYINSSFYGGEVELILETVEDYANLLGGSASFKSNMALARVDEDWATHFPTDPGGWPYAFYESNTKTITLDYAWYNPVLATAPDGKNYFTCQPNYEELLNFPKGSLPGQKLQAKYVLAHEMGHALLWGNHLILDSFTENVDLPLSKPAASDPNPIISRNANRRGFQSEVLADVMASKLYSPGLLNNDMQVWVDNDMPGALR